MIVEVFSLLVVGLLLAAIYSGYRRIMLVRPGDFEELLKIIKQASDVKDLKVNPRMSARRGAKTESVGMIANFTYGVCYTGRIDGKKLDYCEITSERFGSTEGNADSDERKIHQIRNTLLALSRAKRITLEAGQHAEVWTEYGPFTEVDEARLRKDAAEFDPV